MSKRPLHIGVIGSGSWGTALAIVCNRAGSRVTLWSRNENVLRSVRENRINETYLPGQFIDPRIEITDSLPEACKADMLLLVVPSHQIRATCITLSDQLDISVPIVVATKGVERGSLSLMSEVVSAILPKNPVAVLTGPNFASEIARGMPAAATVACQNETVSSQIMHGIGGKFFRTYVTDDLVGAQIGGAVKNVIAIACGVAMGRGLGNNARAAIITRGMAEMSRLCVARGGRMETLMGLSGMGDLVLTCTSNLSRNMSLGVDLGAPGAAVRDVLDIWQKRLAEGVNSVDSVTDMAKKQGVSMPICNAVRDILRENMTVEEAIHSLMERQFVAEM